MRVMSAKVGGDGPFIPARTTGCFIPKSLVKGVERDMLCGMSAKFESQEQAGGGEGSRERWGAAGDSQ